MTSDIVQAVAPTASSCRFTKAGAHKPRAALSGSAPRAARPCSSGSFRRRVGRAAWTAWRELAGKVTGEDAVPPSRALRPASVDREADEAFRGAVAEIEAGVAGQRLSRPEITFDGEPPPRRLAPHAAAVAATVGSGGKEIGWGRFVLLYDPAGQDAWSGPFRIIAYVRAELDPEIAADPLVGEVGWSWLTEALDS